jgi:hypothetical protein
MDEGFDFFLEQFGPPRENYLLNCATFVASPAVKRERRRVIFSEA